MNREMMQHNWLRFFVAAVGFPFLFYCVNLFVFSDHLILGKGGTEAGVVLFGFWLVAMWLTFPDSAGDSDDEQSDEPSEVSVRFIASAIDSTQMFYSDGDVKKLPEVGAEIGLSDPDESTQKIVPGKITKVIPLSHETSEGSTYAIMVQIDSTDVGKLREFGWCAV